MMHLGRVVQQLGRARAFAITAVLTLAVILGICATTCDLLWSFYVRPVPYREPDRLVAVMAAIPHVVTARAVRITDVLKHEWR
jgi:hypothetical protein